MGSGRRIRGDAEGPRRGHCRRCRGVCPAAWALVVDTGPWIFGRKVLLPAGTVQRIDHDERVAYVDRTKDQIKDSPEYDKDASRTPEYRERVGAYYDDSYRTSPPVL